MTTRYDLSRTHLPFLAFLGLFFLTGCVHTSVTRLSTEEYPPLSPSEVAIYLEEEDIPADYEKVALIYVEASERIGIDELYEETREEAAKLGANGILVIGFREPRLREKVAEHFLGIDADREGKLIAIYVYGRENATAKSSDRPSF